MIRRILNAPLFVTLVVAVVYAAYGWLLLHQAHGDVTRFIMAGDKFTNTTQTPFHVAVSSPSDGYDGQFYFRLALDPLTHQRTAFGITLDLPAYRQQRILYPTLAYLLTFGQVSWTPVMLVLVNYGAICLMAFFSSLCAKDLGRHALWGISVPLFAGFFISFAGNLTEITEVTLLLVAFLALQRGRAGLTALFFSLAILARETAILAAISVGAVYLYQHRQSLLRDAILVVAPMTTYLIWQLILISWWGQPSNAGGAANFGAPLVGLVAFLTAMISDLNYFVELLWLIELATTFTFMAVTLRLLRISHTNPGIKVSWLLYLCFALFLTKLVWVNDWAFMRVLSECYALGVLIILGTMKRSGSIALSMQIAVSLLVALYTAFKPF